MKRLLTIALFITLSSIYCRGQNNKIGYRSSDGNQININKSADFGANIISHIIDTDSIGIITFDSDVTKIGDWAFSECSNLSLIALPNTVTSIGMYAFSKSGLEYLLIPPSVSSIGQFACMGCKSLTGIVVKGTTPPTPTYDNDMMRWSAFYSISPSAFICVPQSSISTYKTADGWADYANIITIDPETMDKSEDSTNTTEQATDISIIYVEGGTFQMGATETQHSSGGTWPNEYPLHYVTLDDFYISETEITQAQWEAVMGTTIYQQRDKANPEWELLGVGPNYPMYYVSWEEAILFCQELSKQTGHNVQLPTEAQWEYAARGGIKSSDLMYSGSHNIDEVAWYDSSWYSEDESQETITIHNVKLKQPNELGLYDMTGNVWEYCSDWYGTYSSSTQHNPTGPSSGTSRVMRGGSWYNRNRMCRVSTRAETSTTHRDTNIGFRIVIIP